jgi:hypothetical protein
MTKRPKDVLAPTCPLCAKLALLVTGAAIYPHRPDLAHKYFWQCAPCDAYVGTHDGTQQSLGTPANKELRRARNILHKQMVDPLWQNEPYSGAYDHPQDDKRAIKKIQRSAMGHVYRFLAHKLELPVPDTHIGMFNLDQCRATWRALKGLSYGEIHDWNKRQNELADALLPKKTENQKPLQPIAERVGPARNRPCPCGSGRNYKKCCGVSVP